MDLYKIKLNLVVKIISPVLRVFGFEVPPITAVCAIITNGKKLLVIDLSYKKGYSLPGGGIIARESLEEGLRREVKEETGLEIKDIRYFTSYALPKNYLTALCVCFKARVKNSQRLKSSKEGKPMWVNPKQALKNLAYIDNKVFIKKYFRLT